MTLIKFDFETESEEEILKDKLRELLGVASIIGSKLSLIDMRKDLDRRVMNDNYF